MKLVRVFAVSAMMGAATWSGALAATPELTDPIKIITNNWTSQLVLSNVVGELLKQMGYNVEYTPSDTQLQYTGTGQWRHGFPGRGLGRLAGRSPSTRRSPAAPSISAPMTRSRARTGGIRTT